MEYRIMELNDLPQAVQLYIDYYNTCEEGQWTIETTTKRIRQILTREDSYCLILENEKNMIGFAMGYYEQYDDGFAYDLVEIIIARHWQNQGIGTAFMEELENRIRQAGAMLIQFQAVNDSFHDHFYGKLGYRNARNLVLKTKML